MTAYELGGVLMGTPDSRDPDRCRWFRWMGGNCCEECGGSPFAHDGIRWLRPGTPFRFGALDEDSQVFVTWADYDPGQHVPRRADGTDCPCGPTTEPVFRGDGSMGWVVIHHSLDGREANE